MVLIRIYLVGQEIYLVIIAVSKLHRNMMSRRGVRKRNLLIKLNDTGEICLPVKKCKSFSPCLGFNYTTTNLMGQRRGKVINIRLLNYLDLCSVIMIVVPSKIQVNLTSSKTKIQKQNIGGCYPL